MGQAASAPGSATAAAATAAVSAKDAAAALSELKTALAQGDTAAVTALLEGLTRVHSASEGINVWHLAAQTGDADVVAMVAAVVRRANDGASRNVDHVLASVTHGLSALNLAVNQLFAVAAAGAPLAAALPMLGRNLDCNAPTRTGKTPLMAAVEVSGRDAAQALLQVGADAYATDIHGNTALHVAAWRGDMPCVCLLLEHVDAAEAAAEAGGGSSHLAAAAGDDVAKHRGLVQAANRAGLMPLHLAVWRGHHAAARALINGGAPLAAGVAAEAMGEVSCARGSTVLHLAALKGDVGMIRLVLRAHWRLCELTAAANASTAAAAGGGGGGGGGRLPRDPRRVANAVGRTPFTLAFDLGRSEAAELLDPTVPHRQAAGIDKKERSRRKRDEGKLLAASSKAAGAADAADATTVRAAPDLIPAVHATAATDGSAPAARLHSSGPAAAPLLPPPQQALRRANAAAASKLDVQRPSSGGALQAARQQDPTKQQHEPQQAAPAAEAAAAAAEEGAAEAAVGSESENIST